MKLLVVDDEPNIRNNIREYAEIDGFEVVEAEDGAEAVEKVRNDKFDIIIMDVMMPKKDGYTACREIRAFSDVPIIMLSARTDEYDKLHGYDVGIIEYVEKPYSPKILMQQIKAVYNLSRKKDKAVPQKLTFEGLEIDMAGREVYVNGQKANMTPKEYDLLFYLVENRNIALMRDKLLEEVWGYDFFGDDRTVDTHIKMLRGSLGEYRKFIVTLRGMGYKFEA